MKSADDLNIFKTILKKNERALGANAIYVNMYIEINFRSVIKIFKCFL